MPKPNKGPRLGGGPAHERLLLGNLAAQLFTHKRIQTTETKAKRLQPVAERLVTHAKRGDLHSRRKVLQTITDRGVVHELFTEIAPLVAERPGGYTRIIKTGYRKGDNAPMAVIELVLEPVQFKNKKAEPATEAPAAAETPVVDEAAETANVELDETEQSAEAIPADDQDAEQPGDSTEQVENTKSVEDVPADDQDAEEPGAKADEGK